MHQTPKICVATHHSSIAELLVDAEFRALANRDGFLVELRLDFFSDLSAVSLKNAFDVFAPAVIVTYRHPSEGGKRAGVSDAERLGFLQLAADHGVEYIDIEDRTPRKGFNKRGAKLILSYHDFEKIPDEDTLAVEIWAAMCEQDNVDVVKIAVTPKTAEDLVTAMGFVEFLNGPYGVNGSIKTLFLCMGEAGLWTRILAGYFGAPFTFARGEGASGTAPGQPTWRELEELYRFRKIDANWKVYSVIGNPIGHSLSPLMHNSALAELELNCVYVPLKIDGDPRAAMTRMGSFLDGSSVTIPHKEAIMAACAKIEPAAETIGAVNTLKKMPGAQSNDGSAWHGSNTDAPAAADCLEEALGSLKDKHVLVIGAGGAARAVVVGVKERGARVSVANRTRERAETLAKETGASVVSLDDIGTLQLDAIVNTTPLGMYPNVETSPLTEKQIPNTGLVFDTVYNPLRTRLLDMAEKRGCKTIEGLEMFIRQGVLQFELWTGKTAPRETMRRVVLEALTKRQAAK